jgi:hypothetical protein
MFWLYSKPDFMNCVYFAFERECTAVALYLKQSSFDLLLCFHFLGLAIAADKTMYIADGTNIRAVDPKGIIHTLVGHHGHHNHWTPVPCHGAIPAQQVIPLNLCQHLLR